MSYYSNQSTMSSSVKSSMSTSVKSGMSISVKMRHGSELHKVIQNGGDMAAIETVLAKRMISQFLPHNPDTNGYSPLHYLAISDQCHDRVPKLDRLLRYYTQEANCDLMVVLNVRDGDENTLLHLACMFTRRELVQHLLELGVDIFATNVKDLLPIHYASAGGTMFCGPQDKYHDDGTVNRQGSAGCASPPDADAVAGLLKDLIQHNESIVDQTYPYYVLTPVQIAASSCCLPALQVFWEHKFNFSPRGNKCLFQLVIESGDSDVAVACIEFLCDNKVQNLGNPNGQTPVHIATQLGTPRLLGSILHHIPYALSNCSVDNFGSGPLHYLAASETPSIPCVQLLVDKSNHSNHLTNMVRFLRMKDKSRRTALDICCIHRNLEVAKLILLATFSHEQIANVNVHNWLANHILDRLYNSIPLALLLILDISYAFQENSPQSPLDPNKGPQFDYTVITGVNTSSRARFTSSAHLHHVVHHNVGVQRQMLLHPLIQRYIALHWTKSVRMFAYVSSIAQFVLLINYIVAISLCNRNTGDEQAETINSSTKNGTTPEEVAKCKGSIWCSTNRCGMAGFVCAALALLVVIHMFFKECYHLHQTGIRFYSRKVSNWCRICFAVIAPTSIALALWGTWDEGLWLVSVVGLLFAWLVALLELRNIPEFGIHISCLIQVTTKSIKILTLFGLPTFVVFSQIFQILIQEGTFRSAGEIGVSVKLLAMMIGELTFDEIIKEVDTFTLRHYFVLLTFALFAFVATVVLLNLLVAMAVNITHDMESNARTEVTRCQLEQIYLWETFMPIFKWTKKRSRTQ